MAELGSHAAYRMALYGQWYGEAADLAVDEGLRRMGAGREPGAGPELLRDALTVVVGQLKDLAALGVDSVLWFATLPGARPSATVPFFETLMRDVKPQLGIAGQRSRRFGTESLAGARPALGVSGRAHAR